MSLVKRKKFLEEIKEIFDASKRSERNSLNPIFMSKSTALSSQRYSNKKDILNANYIK